MQEFRSKGGIGQQIEMILNGLEKIGRLVPKFALRKQEAFSIKCLELLTRPNLDGLLIEGIADDHDVPAI